jgi:glycosyltransferase involved in cell wall biosynthesis
MATVKLMNKPVPLLFVIDFFQNPHAGTEGQLFKLIQNIDKGRFDPCLLVFEESNYLKEHGFVCPYTVLGKSSLSNPIMWYRLYNFARSYHNRGGRLAHVYFNDSSIICPPVFAAASIKTIISRRDLGYWYTSAYLYVLKITRCWVSSVVVNSRAVKVVTAEKEGISAEAIRVIYNGYAERTPHTKVSMPVLDSLKKNNKTVLLGLVANIRPIKRITDAIDALALLDKSGQAILVVIGSGDSAELENYAESRAVGGQVVFLGARDDVTDCLLHIDIGLLCSESEGFSNAIIEYMRAGLPTVCSDVGGNIEAITHEDTGLIYPMGDSQSLADCLNVLIGDSCYRSAMGKRARQDSEKRFSISRMVSEHQKLYMDCLG